MKIGFIGLGNMGMAMAGSLLRAGHEVVGYNRTRARSDEFVRRGGRAAQTVGEAAKDTEIVITMLSDDHAVKEVVLKNGGLLDCLPSGRVHVSMSTISPALSRRLAKEHALKGQKYLSASVLGRPDAAEHAKLFVLPSGDAGLIRFVRPVFQALGQKTIELGGDPGASNLVKLSCNLLIATVIEGVSETFALIRKSSCVDPEQYLNVLTSTLFTGGVFEVYGKNVLEHRFKPGFAIPLAMKDIELGLAAGKEVSVPLPLASLIRDHFITAIAQGLSNLDWSALSLVSLNAAGILPEEKKAA